MNARQTRRLEMFLRVEAFGRTHAPEFAPTSQGAKRFTHVSRIIREIHAARIEQRYHANESKEELLEALRLDLRDIVRTARAIGQEEVGFEARFPNTINANPAAIQSAAQAILNELRDPQIAQRFVDHELPSTFVADLEADLAAIEQAAAEELRESQKSVAGTSACERLIREGMKEVQFLDAIVRNKYSRAVDTLREWDSASHIDRAPRAVTGESPTEATPDTPDSPTA